MKMAMKKRKFKKIILSVVGLIILFVLVLIVNLIIFEKNAAIVSKGQLIENYSEPNCALLVVDIQEATTGNISLNSFYKKNSEVLINNINRISDSFKDKNFQIIYIRSEVSNPLINLLNNSFAKGSLGAEFDKRLKINIGLEVVKTRNDAFLDTELDKILTSNKINELYIVGLDAAHCINTTTTAAQNRNYEIKLIEEAILSESDTMKDSMMIVFRDRGIRTLNIDSLYTKE